jgi:excisionase family DNA binding protein
VGEVLRCLRTRWGSLVANTLLTPDQVAEILTISKRSLYELLRRDSGLPVVRLGRAVRFRSIDVEQWIEARAKESLQ